jgi:hypothetical protein
MGTWDRGLFDNDTTADALLDLRSTVTAQAMALLALKPTAARVARVAGCVGLLLQLAPDAYFWTESDEGKEFVVALAAMTTPTAQAFLTPSARKLVAQVAAGTLTHKTAAMAKSTASLLHHGGGVPFGIRHAALFDTAAALAMVKLVGREITEALDEDFEDEDNWGDLCREGMGLGGLGFLLVLTPMPVKAAKLQRWRKLSQKGLLALEVEPDGEIEFQRAYYKNLDNVFALVSRRAE